CDPERDDPFLMKAGDAVQFYPIPREEYDRLMLGARLDDASRAPSSRAWHGTTGEHRPFFAGGAGLVTKLRLKPPSDDERSVRESSLRGGRCAAAKTASKASPEKTCFISPEHGFRRGRGACSHLSETRLGPPHLRAAAAARQPGLRGIA